MTHRSIANPADPFRRGGTAQRAFTLAPLVPSQDATRYQARDMPPPNFALEPLHRPALLRRILRRLHRLLRG
jgi:hypothetical protein